MWKQNTKLRMIDWKCDEWENTNRTAFTAAVASLTLHGTVWFWNITYWKVMKFQLHDATRNYDCFSTRPKAGVVYENWDSQGSVVKDQNLLGYYVVSDCKQLLTFCMCIVPSSLRSNSDARVFFYHLRALNAHEEQDILIIWNHGNCLQLIWHNITQGSALSATLLWQPKNFYWHQICYSQKEEKNIHDLTVQQSAL